MPKLQCPKCKQPIELKSMPADNKVKCGSCSSEFALKAPAKASSTSSSASKPAAASSAAKTGSSTPNPTAKTTASASQTTTKPAASAKPSAAPAATTDPNDPFAALDLNSLGKPKRVDLGVAPIPASVNESPIGNNAPWLAENKPAYKPLSEQEAAAMASGNPYQAADGTASPAPKKSNLGINIFVIVVLVLMAGGSLTAAIIVAMK